MEQGTRQKLQYVKLHHIAARGVQNAVSTTADAIAKGGESGEHGRKHACLGGGTGN
jgi:hypothetical protein